MGRLVAESPFVEEIAGDAEAEDGRGQEVASQLRPAPEESGEELVVVLCSGSA